MPNLFYNKFELFKMKNLLFLIHIVFGQICFGQNDSLKEVKVELTIVISVQETGEPINGLKIKLMRSDSVEINYTTDITGKYSLPNEKHLDFIKPEYTYTISGEGYYRYSFGEFSTIGISTNTRLMREYKILKSCSIGHTKNLPSLRIKGLLTEIDSSSRDRLTYLYMLMIENPAMIISITSLFEHEKDITPFWRRSKTVQAYLIDMGIPKERLIIKIETYSEQTDSIIRERKGGNVIFTIESFDYILTPP